MKKLDIVNSVSRAVHKAGFQIKKHSPEILIVTGVVGTVTAAVMACKATTKVNDILSETKNSVDVIHKGVEDGYIRDQAGVPHEYTPEDGKKDLTIVYTQTGIKFVKLYGPSVALGALSLAGIVWSNRILHKRNVALAAAYATVDRGFKEYRGRLIERFGKELDQELKYNVKTQEIEETVVDENGETKTVKTTVQTARIDEHSEHARFFDETCAGWERDAEYNRWFLKTQQNYANDLLRTRGHLFLNEVYDMLGMQRSRAGNIVGWVYDEKNPVGDNYVDFFIYDIRDEKKRQFVNGLEKSILLDFNVDGDVLSLMS